MIECLLPYFSCKSACWCIRRSRLTIGFFDTCTWPTDDLKCIMIGVGTSDHVHWIKHRSDDGFRCLAESCTIDLPNGKQQPAICDGDLALFQDYSTVIVAFL